MGFKSRADQISHMLPTTRHRCNLEVWWRKATEMGTAHLWHLKRVLSEYDEDFSLLELLSFEKVANP